MATEAPFRTLEASIDKIWEDSAIPSLFEYLRVPNQSPSFDPEWATNGLLEKAMDVIVRWIHSQKLHSIVQCAVHRAPGRTPFLLLELNDAESASTEGAVLIYGHMDKQPPVTGWKAGAGPYEPLFEAETGRLYGRGAADDGYAVYSAVSAIRALQESRTQHGRVFIVIEGGEESGSIDLPYYLDKYLPESKNLSLILCLDSGGHSYDRLWTTDSLRGVAEGILRIETIPSPMHSGLGGGVVPCPFRIARLLLDRIEDATTGEVKIPELHCEIPKVTSEKCAAVDSHMSHGEYTGQLGCGALNLSWPEKEAETPTSALILSNAWKPCVTVTGIDGFPPTPTAGNVIHPEASLKLSIRLPPTVDHETASHHVKRILEADPPYSAKVTYSPNDGGNGWAAKPFASWLAKATEEASLAAFGKPSGAMSLGGSIPLIHLLQGLSPRAEIVVTGVLGPESNAHGPNEFLHVPYVKKLTSCVAHVLRRHFTAMLR